MKLQRDISGHELAKKLRKLGYEITRQKGSHIRLTTQQHSEHQITIPDHNPLRIGTLSGILSDVAAHFEVSKEEIIMRLLE